MFQEPFEVTVGRTWASTPMKSQDVKPVIPVEHLMAFILLLA